jgi:hypothetical protein
MWCRCQLSMWREFGIDATAVALGIQGGRCAYDRFTRKSATRSDSGLRNYRSGKWFDVMVNVDDRPRGSTIGPHPRWQGFAIAAASVATILGLWALAIAASGHDYPLPPTSTFDNVGSELSVNHR